MSGLKVTERRVYKYDFQGIARGPSHVKAVIGGDKFRQLLVRYFAVEKQHREKYLQRVNTSPSGPYGSHPSYSQLEKEEDSLRRAMVSLAKQMETHRGFARQPAVTQVSQIRSHGYYIRIDSDGTHEQGILVRGQRLLLQTDLGGKVYKLVAEQVKS